MRFSVRSSLIIMAVAVAVAVGCGSDSPTAPTPLPTAPFSSTDIVVGSGPEAVAGNRLLVHYTLWLYDPTRPENKGQFYQSSVGGAPFEFVLAPGNVIAGWVQGVPGMRVGGTRRLIIPPNLAYGAQGSGPIPPNATLVFDVELLAIQ
jgi:FKBP-type peptidyl-prolyl cis-trans isomerase FkpA